MKLFEIDADRDDTTGKVLIRVVVFNEDQQVVSCYERMYPAHESAESAATKMLRFLYRSY